MAVSHVPLAASATLGELLKFLRRRSRLSQRDLSIAVGYSESHISRIENNERPVDRATLLALFVPALHIRDEPDIIDRLLTLCTESQSTFNVELSVVAMPDPPSQPTTRSRLPAQLTSFIGRNEEMLEMTALLAKRANRLITLTGVGGSGKTRLALAVGEEVAPDYSHGVWLVELAPLSEPQGLAQRVAAAFQLSETGGQPQISLLIDFLYARQALLILDNCEHLVEAAAELTVALLRACPQLQVLATSRETLGLPGEINFLVQPLALPPLQRGAQPSRAAVEGYDAIRLFVERAHTTLRSFSLTDQNAAAIARICQRLDGIPLGIELAAAWINVLPAEQIAARLELDFDLSTGNNRTVLPRHQTLAAAIEWSYNLLTVQEQRFLRSLSIFVGGWGLEAAEAVAADADSKQALKLLNGLVNKSLVTVDHLPEGGVRYRLLDSICEFLRKGLSESNEEQQLRDRHLAYFVALAESSESQLKSHEQMAWLVRLNQEQENFRSAVAWSLSCKKIAQGLRLVGALHHYWWMNFNIAEGRRWCEAMLNAASEDDTLAHSVQRAKALFSSGLFSCLLLDLERARRDLEDSLRIYQKIRDDAGAGAVLCFLGNAYFYMNDSPRAIRLYQEALQYSQRAEDAWWIAETMH